MCGTSRKTSNPCPQGSSFFPSQLPIKITTSFSPGSLQTFQCERHEEKVQPLAEGVVMLPSWLPHILLFRFFCGHLLITTVGADSYPVVLEFLSLSFISTRDTKITGLLLRPVPRSLWSWLLHSSLFVLVWKGSPRDPCPNSKFLVSRLCTRCQSFVNTNLRTSSFFIKSFDVFPQNTVQLLFCLITVVLGSIKVALHLFNEAPCFVLFIFSFPNFYELVFAPTSISFFLFFRPWPHFRPL